MEDLQVSCVLTYICPFAILAMFRSVQLGFRESRRRGEYGMQETSSEQERTEGALKESEARFRLLTEAAFGGVAITEEGTIVEASTQFAELYGYQQDELVGRPMRELIAPEARHDAMRRILSGYDQPYESLCLRKDGSVFSVEVCGKNYRIGGRERRITAVRDITVRKQAEQALHQRAAALEALQATVLDIVVPHDLDTLLETVVERAAMLLDAPSGAMYLCEPAQAQVRMVVSHGLPRDYRGTVLAYGEGAAGMVAQTGEALIIDDYRAWPRRASVYEKEQSFRAVLAVPMMWQGQVIGVIDILRFGKGNLFDERDLELLALLANHAAIAVENARLHELAQVELAGRKRFEQKSEQRRLFLEWVFEYAPDAMVALDHDNCVLEWNQGAENLFGYSRDEVLGQNLDELVAKAEASRYQEARRLTQRILSGETISPTETVRYHKDGTHLDVILAASPILLGGQQAGSVAIYTDITERKRAEAKLRHQAEALEVAVERLRELDKVKSEVMQNVSHELRTPLSLIWGYAGMLVSGELGELEPLQQGAVESIVRQAETLNALVEDITLLLVTEQRGLPSEPVAMDELVAAAVDDFRLVAEEAHLSLRAEVTPGLPQVLGTPVHLRRVLENLLDNAIKFTPANGEVMVRLWQREQQIILQVSDTGIGIEPEAQPRVFERFYQAADTQGRRRSGTGLGLALVKEITESYGGTVSVESSVGQGSIFTVALPVV
jgi:PAS domain S-box-containing protein